MGYRPRRKRNIYTSPENKITAVERVLKERIPTKQMAEEMNACPFLRGLTKGTSFNEKDDVIDGVGLPIPSIIIPNETAYAVDSVPTDDIADPAIVKGTKVEIEVS